ncbi:MAG: VWA domain-containing protein [Acidobacteriota bacterium]|nr:MAG: VWA domain-containing protein [Acidobacteriota bacterium]
MRYFGAFLGIVLTAAFAASQTPAPKPSPTPETDVVRISTNLIRLDVTVTDSKGKVITDLRPDEIEIYENGVKQQIEDLRFISATRPVETRPAVPGVPVPPRTIRPENVRRTIALVVDDLSLSFESAYQTRRSLKKFVDEQMQEGDLVAIIRTGAGIGALQQFTSDKRVLYAAIEKVKWNPLGSGGIGAFAAFGSSALPADEEGEEETDAPAVGTGSGETLEEFRSQVFATGTLGALRYVVTGMSELPGRKSVILFSDGFRIFEGTPGEAQTAGTVFDYLRRLVDTANRNSVVFYAVDARGLKYTGITAEDYVSEMSAEQRQNAVAGRGALLAETQDGLKFLSDSTGGFAIVNSNDLAGGVRRVLEDQSYYLVSYEPSDETFDPEKRRFNRLEVKVLRRGVTVRHRSGFFNTATPEAAQSIARFSDNSLHDAIFSPFGKTEINMRLNALFGVDPKSAGFVRSLLHIDPSKFDFAKGEDGTRSATFELLAVSFGDNGELVDQLSKSYTMSIKPAAFDRVVKDGFVYHFAFPAKAGAYQYRIAIRDTASGRVGSASQFVQVPDLRSRRLTLSSIVIENITAENWRRISELNEERSGTDPMTDTALRRVKRNTVLRYGFEVYNARLAQNREPRLTMQIRVFRDGKVILEGKETPIDTAGQADLQRIKASGALAIGEKMQAGDHILQIVVTDRQAGGRNNSVTQYVEFEVIGN